MRAPPQSNSEFQALQLCERFTHLRLRGFRTIEQQKSATTGTRELTTKRARAARPLIKFVDGRRADLGRQAALYLPASMQSQPERVEITHVQEVAHFIGKIHHSL